VGRERSAFFKSAYNLLNLLFVTILIFADSQFLEREFDESIWGAFVAVITAVRIVCVYFVWRNILRRRAEKVNVAEAVRRQLRVHQGKLADMGATALRDLDARLRGVETRILDAATAAAATAAAFAPAAAAAAAAVGVVGGAAMLKKKNKSETKKETEMATTTTAATEVEVTGDVTSSGIGSADHSNSAAALAAKREGGRLLRRELLAVCEELAAAIVGDVAVDGDDGQGGGRTTRPKTRSELAVVAVRAAGRLFRLVGDRS
jgi:hypothetical protein